MITMCDFEALTTPTNVKVSQANGLIPGFVFKKDFSKTFFQFYQQIFHHPLFDIIPMYWPNWKIQNVFLQLLNGVNIVNDFDLQMSNNVQQLVVVCNLFIISGVYLQLKYKTGMSFL